MILAALLIIAALLSYMVHRLERIERMLNAVKRREKKMADIGQEILDKVTAEGTAVDSVIALLQGLQANGTITPEVEAQILAAISGQSDKLNAALTANVPGGQMQGGQ